MRATWLIPMLSIAGGTVAIAAAPVGIETAAALTAAPSQAEADAILQRLTALWDARLSEIVSADISFRLYRNVVTESELTRDEALALLDEYDLVGNPDSLAELIPRLKGTPAPTNPPWSSARFVQDGSNTRFEFDPFTAVRHGDTEFHVDQDNGQVSVYTSGRSLLDCGSLQDFRWMPLKPFDVSEWQVTNVDRGVIDLGIPEHSILLQIDEPTGLSLRQTIYRPDTNEPLTDRFELGIVEHADGIPFPTVTLSLNYRKGLLARIAFRVVESAQFNTSIPPETFQIAQPRDTVVIDYRGDRKTTFSLPQNTDDLAKLLTAHTNGAQADLDALASDSGRLRWLLLINAIVLLIAGVLLWRRGRPRQEPGTDE